MRQHRQRVRTPRNPLRQSQHGPRGPLMHIQSNGFPRGTPRGRNGRSALQDHGPGMDRSQNTPDSQRQYITSCVQPHPSRVHPVRPVSDSSAHGARHIHICHDKLLPLLGPSVPDRCYPPRKPRRASHPAPVLNLGLCFLKVLTHQDYGLRHWFLP